MAPQNSRSDISGFSFLPEKRGNRAEWCSFILFVSATIFIIIISLISPNVAFKEDKDAVCTRKNSSESLICYKKEETHLARFLAITFGIISAILATSLQRLTLVTEEYHHVPNRYGGSPREMLRACFSGVKWKAVLCAAIAFLAIICMIFAGDEDIDIKQNCWKYTIVLLSSIGFGPLVLHLLNLDTPSEVHISTIIENQEKCVGNGLAWFYYFSYLKKVLPHIKRNIKRSKWRTRPISYKLFILIPYGCDTGKNIEDLDDRFHKEKGVINYKDLCNVGVYRVEVTENQSKYFAIEYASPLEILREMSIAEPVGSVPNNKRNEELKMFYRTLAEILKEPRLVHLNCYDTCELVPFDPSKSIKIGTTKRLDHLFNFFKLASQGVSQATRVDIQGGIRQFKNDRHLRTDRNATL